MPQREGHFYEEPSAAWPILDHDILSIQRSFETLCRIHGIAEKKVYSLFIGRWQPLHAGHLVLFDRVRREGKNIAIGVRDTEVSESNPYTLKERIDNIKTKVPDAKVFAMPDIEEVVHGRKVGWGIREIRLDEGTESISATKIRESLP